MQAKDNTHVVMGNVPGGVRGRSPVGPIARDDLGKVGVPGISRKGTFQHARLIGDVALAEGVDRPLYRQGNVTVDLPSLGCDLRRQGVDAVPQVVVPPLQVVKQGWELGHRGCKRLGVATASYRVKRGQEAVAVVYHTLD